MGHCLQLNPPTWAPQTFLQTGLVKSSRFIYAAGLKRYLYFCNAASIKPILTSKCALTLFTMHLAMSNTSRGLIKVYHVCKGLHDHFRQHLTPQLHLILRGIKR